jgi:uncharacterized protein (TIGR03086 family)
MFDLEPATSVLARLVEGVRDDQLALPTPCADTSLGALVEHVDGLSLAFAAAATKTALPDGRQGPSTDGPRLGSDWRIRIPARLAALAAVWRDEAAWTGMTRAGGQELAGEAAGIIALDEVIVHSWDIAVASGQSLDWDPQLVEAAFGFVQPTVAQNPHGVPGLFGSPVAVAEHAPALDRLLGLTGRDPSWRARMPQA